MMLLLTVRKMRLCLLMGALLALPAFPCAADIQNDGGPYPMLAQNAAPLQNSVGTLQISGTTENFNVIADRADVKSVLSLLFGQAEKQFTLDNNVAGQVTARLMDQPFARALDAICRQTFLKYRYDPATEVYTLSRDAEAVKKAFTQLKTLNSHLADQLRLMGLPVPGLDAANGVYNFYQNTDPYQNLRQYGRFGGGRSLGQQDIPGPAGRANALPNDKSETSQKALPRARQQKDGNTRVEKITRGGVSEPGNAPATEASAQSLYAAPGPAKPNPAGGAIEADALQQLKLQNNMVELRMPREQKIPVRDAILALGAQANTPILFDTSVPGGSKFRIWANIPARTLPEALNTLSPYARLEWRWVGNTIFVTTTPDFELFWGDPESPRVRYGDSLALPQAESALKESVEPQAAPKKGSREAGKPAPQKPKPPSRGKKN